MRLAVGLFVVIASASLLGALLVQQASDEFYLNRYGVFWGHLILLLRLDDVFHSFWFEALLLLLSLSILICTLRRLKGAVGTAFRVSFRDETTVRNLKPFREIELKQSLGDSREMLLQALGRRLYRTKIQRSGPENQGEALLRIFASKGGISCFGPTLVHLSILFVLVGGAWTGIRGYRRSQVLREGESLEVSHASFQVRLDSFSIEWSEEGKVRQYESRVTVVDEGGDSLERTIMVNHPLLHRGIHIYQSGYGTELRELSRAKFSLTNTESGFPPVTIDVPFGERMPLVGTDLSIRVVDFVPDFLMDGEGIVTTRSEEHRNPACRVEVFRGDSVILQGWRFLNFPQVHPEGGKRYYLQLLGYEPKYYTVLQVARTPGLTFIYGSFILASLGLCLSFYVPQRRVWATILPVGDGKARLLIGGHSSRDQRGLEKEVDLIVHGLRS